MRLSEERKVEIRRDIGPRGLTWHIEVCRALLAELDEVTRERDEARRVAGDLFVAIWPIDRPGTPPKNLTDAFERWQAGGAPEPSGAPTEYSDTDSGTLDLPVELIETPKPCRSCSGKGKTTYNRYPPSPRNNSGLVTCVRCSGSGKEPGK